jgi:uncharacterized protein
MNKLEYENLKFVDFDDKRIKIMFKQRYYFFLDKAELIQKIGKFEIDKINHSIINFNAPIKRAQIRFDNFIEVGLDNLYNSNKDKQTIYIYEDLVPLIGTNEFGIVDRNTSIIEIKPSTGCNLACLFCSVGEGVNDKIDYLVEPNYLVEEIRKLVELKQSDSIEVNIGPQGEPLLYPDIFYLIKELKQIPKIKVISMNSNGRLLTKEIIDKLIDAGLDRVNLSLHSTDEEKQKEISGSALNLDLLKELIVHANDRLDFLLAPVYIPTLNEDMESLVVFAKEYKKTSPLIGIQNFLNYKGGRNPVKQKSFSEFYEMLNELEKKHKVKLKLNKDDFKIVEDEALVKPFAKGQVIDAVIKIPGRRKNEVIAVAQGRSITVYDCEFVADKKIRVKLSRDKHNIFSGVRV